MNTRPLAVITGCSIGLFILLTWATGIVGVQTTPAPEPHAFIEVPDGFNASTYTTLRGSPRLIRFHDGTLFVSNPDQGSVQAVQDTDWQGPPEAVTTVVDGLDRPHGMAFHDDQLYVATTTRVLRYDLDGTAVTSGAEVLIDGIPSGGHWTRTIRVINGSLFLSVGSSCNVCASDRQTRWRARILRCDLDGTDCSTYADGLRNTVGFVEHDGRIIGTDNGRDNIGLDFGNASLTKDLPPDEINIIKEDRSYGWPYCFGQNRADPAYGNESRCRDATSPAVELQAHSAPLGLGFYTAEAFPRQYRGDLFVAYHGSWNREPPTGYKVVRIEYDGETRSFGNVTDFATGWLAADGTVRGRPVDVAVGPEGSMFVSDDSTGRIYRIGHPQ